MGTTKIIKYAIENTVTLPVHYTDEDIENCIKTFAKGHDYVWCEAHTQLLGSRDATRTKKQE